MPAPDQRKPVVLIAAAAPKEARAIARGLGCENPPEIPLWTPTRFAPGFELVRTGVGPAAAAAGLARALDPSQHRVVLSLGVGGALPGKSPPELGSVVLATRSEFADLGAQTPAGFCSIEQMGFATTSTGDVFAPEPRLAEALGPLVDTRGPIATVSVCSGTDAHALAIRDRLGSEGEPAAEAMEGAAIGLVAAVIGVAFAEIRVISNTTGDRESQRWDLDGALERLARTARDLAQSDALSD